MSKKVTMKAKKVVTKKGAKTIVSPKLIAKKVAAAKKAVAKKKVTKEAIKQKYQKLYKIVANYSENLMQDVYSVVYRTKELKRFIN